MPREIPLSCIVDNTGDYSTKGIHRGRRRTITIMIDLRSDPGGDSWYQIRLFGGAIDGGDTVPAARLQLGQRDAYSAITDLQTEWRDRLIHRREEDSAGGYWFPFVDEWDLSVVHGQKERLAEIMPRLAREGHKLFALLFRTGDEELTALADVLVAALRAGPQVVTVHSDDLFVPWWLLYVPESDDVDLDDDNAEWNWEGFWGYRHLVEHRTPWSPKWSPCLPVDPGERPVAGVNVDERLDEEFQKTPVIAPIVSMFQSRTTAVVRQSRSHLARDLKSPDHRDQIVYFGCHGDGLLTTQGEARGTLRLTDQAPINSDDLKVWLNQNSLPSRPLVFINACQGGRMSSMFYTAIGRILLAKGASCIVGPQIDIPPLFAREYALEFFAQLLKGDRAGDIILEITHACALRGNPLALVLSMYNGLDTHFCSNDTGLVVTTAGPAA